MDLPEVVLSVYKKRKKIPSWISYGKMILQHHRLGLETFDAKVTPAAKPSAKIISCIIATKHNIMFALYHRLLN